MIMIIIIIIAIMIIIITIIIIMTEFPGVAIITKLFLSLFFHYCVRSVSLSQ